MLAVDLGAESGRGILGSFDGERLVLEEIHRFANEPVRLGHALVWDFPCLYRETLASIRRGASSGPLASIGVDAWGVDFGLLDERDNLLGLPVHYRDARTDGFVEAARARVPAERIFGATGTQAMAMNTVYQLMSMVAGDAPILRQARTLLTIPNLVLHFLSGSAVMEYTSATTTGCYDIVGRAWAHDLLEDLGVPDALFPPVVAPGTVLGGLLGHVADDVGAGRASIIAPATHDTASAVAATPLAPAGGTAFISSGTWSLLGVEVGRPILDSSAMEANLTNEGGLGDETLLIRSLTGTWLLQECRRALARAGMELDHATLLSLGRDAPKRTAFIDPDDARLFRPTDLPAAVRSMCHDTGQPPPTDGGTLVRVLLESLALKYAWTIRQLEAVTGRAIDALHVVGGGARNDLLCQLTSDAAGLPVSSGPIEAAATGNLLGQAMAAGQIGSLVEAREVVRRSFTVRTYEPRSDRSGDRERFARVMQGSSAARHAVSRPAADPPGATRPIDPVRRDDAD